MGGSAHDGAILGEYGGHNEPPGLSSLAVISAADGDS